MRTAEEYLDEQFPKGKTKFRGQAMVLLALAREEGRLQALADVEKIIDKCSNSRGGVDLEYLKQEIAKEERK